MEPSNLLFGHTLTNNNSSDFIRGQATTINDIPKEVMQLIFKQLEFKDLVKGILVNKEWKNLIDNEEMWYLLCKRDFSCSLEDSKQTKKVGFWKSLYCVSQINHLFLHSEAFTKDPTILALVIKANGWTIQFNKEATAGQDKSPAQNGSANKHSAVKKSP